MVSFSVKMKTQTGDTTNSLINTNSADLAAAKAFMTVIMKGTLTRSK
jgi:hypothetical protein